MAVRGLCRANADQRLRNLLEQLSQDLPDESTRLEEDLEKYIEEALEKCLEKGIEKGHKEVARRMKEMGLSMDLIVQATGVAPQVIEKL